MSVAPRPLIPKTLFSDPLNLLAAACLVVWGSVALFGRPIGDFGVETDFYGDFAHYAREWAGGRPNLMNGFRGPLYYLVLALFEVLRIDLFAAAKAISVISAAAVVRLSGGLLRRLFGGAAGLAGAVVVTANPVSVAYGYKACSDLFFFALFAGALFLLFRREEASRWDWAAAGALAAGAYLTRYNGLFLVPAAAAVALIRFGFRRPALASLALYGAAFTAVALPWWIFVAARTGDPLWNNAFHNVAITVLAGNPNRAQSGNFMGSTGLMSLRDVWDVSPGLFLSGMARNAVDHLLQDVTHLAGPVWAAAALVGLALNLKSWFRRNAIAFATAGAITYLSLLPVFYNARFMLVLVLWWAAAAGGVAAWAAALRRHAATAADARNADRGSRKKKQPPGKRPAPPGRLPGFAALLAFLIAGAIFTAQGVVRAGDETGDLVMPTEVLALAKEVKRLGVNVGRSTPISARKPHIGYYLNAPVVPIVLGNTANMRAAGVHYLLVSGIEAAYFPSLRSMWAPRTPADIGAGFRLVAAARVVQPDGGERRATLYALDDPIPWVPAPSNPVAEEEPPPPGLSRIDFLRMKMARWYLRWDAEFSPDALLKLMAPDALDHPDVLPIRADLALRNRDYALADTLYRRILDLRPGDERALYCLAGLSLLRKDEAGFESSILATIGDRTAPLEPSHFHDRAQAYLREMDYIPALAPVTILLRATPDGQWALMSMAYIQQALHRYPEALDVLTTFLKHYPNDPEALGMIKAVREEGGL